MLGSWTNNKNVTVTDIKLGEGNIDEVLLKDSLPIMTNDDSKFVISNLSHSSDSNDNINISFDSTHKGNNMLIVSEPGNNTYVVSGNSFKATENGEYKVFAVSQLSSGKYSNVISKNLIISHNLKKAFI